MFLHKVFSVALAILWSSALVSSASVPRPRNSCTNPELRKEWRAFSTDEKAEWIRALNCVGKLPHDPALAPSVDPKISLIPPVNTSGSYYDDIVYLHMDLNTLIHYTGQFLPWHRWYVNFLGETLKEKCGYTGVTPYWNWTIDAHNFYESSFWDSDPVSGLGGWGDPNNDIQIHDGGLSDFIISYPVAHHIRRNFTIYTWANIPSPLITEPHAIGNESFTSAVVESILEIPPGDYEIFQKTLEAIQGPHGGVHGTVAGDMAGGCPANSGSSCTIAPTWSSNDPLFFLHHAMIDKIWYDWQMRDPLNAQSFFGGSVESINNLTVYNENPTGVGPYLDLNSIIPVDGFYREVTIGDMLSTTSGALCYKYV